MATSRRKLAEDLLKRLRLENVSKFRSLVKLHVSFCVELNADELESLTVKILPDNAVKKRRSTRSSASFLQKFIPFNVKKQRCSTHFVGTFGAPLTHEGVAEMSQLITFLMQDEKNLREEGLFRKSGSSSRQNDLRKMLNFGETVDLLNGKYSVHDVASVFKLYLQELPEPLLTEAHFGLYIQLSGFVQENMSRIEKNSAKNRQIRLIRLLFLLLPGEIVEFLRQILLLLKSVAEQSASNKMTMDNLGKIFGPLLLCPKTLSAQEIHKNADSLAFVVSFMIDHCDEIFIVPKEILKDVLALYKEKQDKTFELSTSPEACTTVTFVDHTKSVDDSAKYNTTTALAELFAHVQMMPNGPQKDKLMKQFQTYNRENLGCNKTISRATKNAGTSLKRKLNRTRESFSRLSTGSSRSSLGTISSSSWSSLNQTSECSFGSSVDMSRQVSLSSLTIKQDDNSSNKSTPKYISQEDYEEPTPTARRKMYTRHSFQYNLRNCSELANNIVIERL